MTTYNPSYCLRHMTVKVTFVYLSQNKAVLKPGGQLGDFSRFHLCWRLCSNPCLKHCVPAWTHRKGTGPGNKNPRVAETLFCFGEAPRKGSAEAQMARQMMGTKQNVGKKLERDRRKENRAGKNIK